MYPHFTPTQLKSLKKASRIAARTFQEIKKIIQPGWTEKQTSTKINQIMKNLGAERLAFRTIVAAGSHSSEVHHKNTTRKIRKNDIVLLDFGCKVKSELKTEPARNHTRCGVAPQSNVAGPSDGSPAAHTGCEGIAGSKELATATPMCSDFSRTIFIGKPKPQWRKVYHIVHSAQQKALRFLSLQECNTQGTPGKGNNITIKQYNNFSLKASQLDSIARNYIKSKGYGKHFPHGLGHGLGNKVHQYFKIGPKSKASLRPGFVFTIEPAVYLKNKFGVRLEDVIYLSPKGPEILTKM